MNIVLIITIAFLIFLSAERLVITRRVKSIPYRIHVNGTRGKSSVARYIGVAMSASQKSTFVKITGIVPTLYFPDGTSRTIQRLGKARVQEQFSIISQAFKHRADALVMECMSLNPEYQQLESRIFLPHVTVITNIEDDHREEMGISDEEHVQAIAASIPYNSIVYTSDSKHQKTLQLICNERRTKVHIVSPLNPEFSAQLPEGMFAANVSLALAVALHFGIDENRAFNAIKNLKSESQCVDTTINGFQVRFINGFAVNDVPSAVCYIKYWSKVNTPRKIIVIVNTRNDRPLRTVEFAKWCATLSDLHHIFIVGTHASFASRLLKKTSRSLSSYSIVDANNLQAKLSEVIQAETDVFGIGNIAGEGFEIIEHFKKKDAV